MSLGEAKSRRASEKLTKHGAWKGTWGQGGGASTRGQGSYESWEGVEPALPSSGLAAGGQAPSDAGTFPWCSQPGAALPHVPGLACVTQGCGTGDGGHAQSTPVSGGRAPAPGWPAGGGGVQVSGCVDTREGVTERPGDGCNANSFCRQEPPGKVAPRFRILRSRDQCLLSWAAQLWISCHAATDNAHIREYGESSLNNTTLSCWNGLALGPGLWGHCQRRSC